MVNWILRVSSSDPIMAQLRLSLGVQTVDFKQTYASVEQLNQTAAD